MGSLYGHTVPFDDTRFNVKLLGGDQLTVVRVCSTQSLLDTKPEPIMLLNSPIILSGISQKFYLLFSKSIPFFLKISDLILIILVVL